MDPDFAQRRRTAIAVGLTVILVPAAFLLNRGGDDDGDTAPAMTLVGTIASDGPAPDGGDASASPADEPAADATDALGTVPVAYLDGTVPPDDGDAPTIAIPRVGQSITGTATFRHSIDDVARCIVQGVPFNSTVTITNLDNSRSVQCTASIGYGNPPPADDVVMHTEAFNLIADLTDAPVPVEISW